MVSTVVWWGDACILGIVWACYRNADGVSFIHCWAKQVPINVLRISVLPINVVSSISQCLGRNLGAYASYLP